MLDLSRVTLLFVETRAHKITERVINDCLSKAKFGDVMIYTDKPDLIPIPGARVYPVPDFPNKKLAGQFYYSKAMEKVETDFALMLEWDAGIFDPDKWLPDFFDYDYIGAPWNVRHDDPYDVGNGGFTLMSKRLGHFLCEHTAQYPVATDWDICRIQRRHLEPMGFKWAPYPMATRFAWELAPRCPDHFGYHGAFRWIDVLSRDEIVVRARFMTESPYLLTKMKDIFRYAPLPWLEQEIGEEAWKRYAEVVPQPPSRRAHMPGQQSAQQRAAMLLMQAQRRGLVTYQQSRGLKA